MEDNKLIILKYVFERSEDKYYNHSAAFNPISSPNQYMLDRLKDKLATDAEAQSMLFGFYKMQFDSQKQLIEQLRNDIEEIRELIIGSSEDED